MTRPCVEGGPHLDRRELIVGSMVAGIACLSAGRLAAASTKVRTFSWPDIGGDWTDGLPLANGDLGGMIWSRGGDVVLSIDRTDVWDFRPVPEFGGSDFTYANLRRLHAARDAAEIARIFEKPFHNPGRGKLPLGRLALGLKSNDVAGSVLDVGEGVATVTLEDGTVVTGLIASEHPVGLLRAAGPSAGRIINAARIERPPYGERPKPVERRSALDYGTAADLGYPEPLDLGGDDVSGYASGAGERHFAALARIVPGEGDARMLVWTVATAPERYAAASQARALLASWGVAGAAARLERHHRAWWRDFWTRSSVASGSPALDRRWLLSTYHLGAAVREGKAPVPLQAPWTWDNGKLPAWKGDYHHDLNTQMTYWPVYAGNRPGMSANFVDWLWATRDAGFQYARDFFGAPGLNVSGTADLLNRPLGGWAAYSYSPTTSAWLLHHFDLHWRHFGDAAFLRDRAYPYASAVTAFLNAVLKERPGRSELFLPLSSSPEINDNKLESWFTEWTNFDLALVRYAVTAAADMAAAPGDPAAARHRATLARLPDFARDEDGGFSIAQGTPLQASHRHFSHLLAFYPLRLLDPSRDPAAARALEASLARLERLGTKMWMGYSFAWLASLWAMLGRGDKASAALATFEEGFSGRNGFHTNGDASGRGITAFPGRLFTLEGGNAACAAVQEMMLQGTQRDLRLFPAPAGGTARFDRLRAPGGLDVSARLEGGRVAYARLTADRPVERVVVGPGLAERRVRIAPGRPWVLGRS